MILSFIADSQKYAVNLVDPATQTLASIAATKGSAFHMSSQKSAWIIDSGPTDHMPFDPGQLIRRKSSTSSVVFKANGTSSLDIHTGKMIGCGTRQDKLYYLDWALDSETKDVTLLQNDWLPPLSSSNQENLLQNDRSPEENDQLSPHCQT
ncbi:hypothetical protein L3X38_018395 [Prunus dulcis]|uniref:Uncharacterized protein n=1 Tax=Prunus dulcis TaxID=3755 RepID=A0AAD4W955_PRUDU|nr:hypothetical protein L3X38_018395 [Prunus dulcis]